MHMVGLFPGEKRIKRTHPTARLGGFILGVLVYGAIGSGFSGTAQAVINGQEADALGMVLFQVFEQYGMPLRMYVQRGDEPWQDDIVFFYNDFSYIYWNNDRVWQVRFDHRHLDPIFGVRMGQDLASVRTILGEPVFQAEDELLYRLAERGFPIRLRLLFGEQGLEDAYVYRSEF